MIVSPAALDKAHVLADKALAAGDDARGPRRVIGQRHRDGLLLTHEV